MASVQEFVEVLSIAHSQFSAEVSEAHERFLNTVHKARVTFMGENVDLKMPMDSADEASPHNVTTTSRYR